MSWSKADWKAVTDLIALGYSAGIISDRVGRTRNSIIGKAWRDGVKLGGRRTKHSKGLEKPRSPKSQAKKKPLRDISQPFNQAPVFRKFLDLDPVDYEKYGKRPDHCGAVEFADIGHQQCRFMHGHDADKLFCGNKTKSASQTYCEPCKRVVYR